MTALEGGIGFDGLHLGQDQLFGEFILQLHFPGCRVPGQTINEKHGVRTQGDRKPFPPVGLKPSPCTK